jgi:hypothetical protein
MLNDQTGSEYGPILSSCERTVDYRDTQRSGRFLTNTVTISFTITLSSIELVFICLE